MVLVDVTTIDLKLELNLDLDTDHDTDAPAARLAWSRDGRLLAVAEPGRVSIHRPRAPRGPRGHRDVVQVTTCAVRGVVAFDDHVWIAERIARGAMQLRRIDEHGRTIGV